MVTVEHEYEGECRKAGQWEVKATHDFIYNRTQTMGNIESVRKHTAPQTAWVKLPDTTQSVKEAY